MKNRSLRYNKIRPRFRHIQKYSKSKECLIYVSSIDSIPNKLFLYLLSLLIISMGTLLTREWCIILDI